jgi:hypothetical protein
MRKYIPSSMVIAACILLCAASAHAFDAGEFQSAQKQLLAASAGDSAATPKAVEQFKRLVQAEPGHPLLLVSLGAVTALQAKDTILPWKKMSYAEDGMAMQDKALALLNAQSDTQLQDGVPLSLWVRFSAASTFLSVPDLFHRRAQGEKLLREVQDSPLLAAAPAEFKRIVQTRAEGLAK